MAHLSNQRDAPSLNGSACRTLAPCARSYGSLYQHPPRGFRTSKEKDAFDNALNVMGDLCESSATS